MWGLVVPVTCIESFSWERTTGYKHEGHVASAELHSVLEISGSGDTFTISQPALRGSFSCVIKSGEQLRVPASGRRERTWHHPHTSCLASRECICCTNEIFNVVGYQTVGRRRWIRLEKGKGKMNMSPDTGGSQMAALLCPSCHSKGPGPVCPHLHLHCRMDLPSGLSWGLNGETRVKSFACPWCLMDTW